MKKILIVFHDNDILSGATRSMVTLLLSFNQSKHFKVEAMVPNKNGELVAYLQANGIFVHEATYGGNVYSSNVTGVKKVVAYIRCLAKTIISYISSVFVATQLYRDTPDIIYSNTSTIYFGAWLSKMLRVKHIWHFREYCLEDQSTVRIFPEYFRKLAQCADRVVTISKKLDQYYREQYGLKNTVMLYDDISSDYLCDEKICHDGIKLLVTGSLAASKGQKIAIQAIESLNNRNAVLYLAGKMNEYGKELQQYVLKHNVNGVVFLGLISDMTQLRKTIDFSIVAANSEAFGRTIIEDMLAGVIVIGCDTGSVPELIQDGITGFLYQYGNVQELREKIEYAMNHPTEVEVIRKNAKKFALGFIQNGTAEELMELMEGF